MTGTATATTHVTIDRLCAFFAARGLDAWLVGGAVRDRLLGRAAAESADVDLAVAAGDAAAAVSIGRALADELDGTLVPLSPERGIMRVVISGGDDDDAGADKVIDFTAFAGDIADDLGRRDFTVNAMGVPLAQWRGADFGAAVLDPCGGRADLARKTLRATAPGVFADDPGRMLRAVRLAGELGLRIEPETARQLRDNAHRQAEVHPVRARDEFLRLLAPDGARARLESLDRLGLLAQLIPELMATRGVEQPRRHYWDVWGHSLHAVEAAEGVTRGHQHSPVYSCVPWTPESAARFGETVMHGHTRRTALKLAALFHDIAKPQTKTLEADGRTRFFGHAEQGAAVAQSRLRRLGISARGSQLVAQMVRQHMRPFQMGPPGRWPGNRAIYRYFRELGGAAVDTLYLSLADFLATKGPELAHPEWLNYARMVSHILYVGSREPVSSATPRLVNGHDLMSHLGLRPGPHIGGLLAAIEEARAAGEIETQEQGLALAAAALHDGRYAGGDVSRGPYSLEQCRDDDAAAAGSG